MNTRTSDQVFQSLVEAAREACREIERIDLHNTQGLLSALIQLLREANYLSQCSIEDDSFDLDEAASLPEALIGIPDDVVFHVVFDPLNPESVCALSVKDGLGDIYRSLASGLRVLDTEPAKKKAVFWEWRFNYQFHWGRHLIDMIRFLMLSGLPKPQTNSREQA